MTDILTRFPEPQIVPTDPVELSVDRSNCPVIPQELTEEERQRVLNVCLGQGACSGAITGVTGMKLCCKGTRDAIEMGMRVLDIRQQRKEAQRKADDDARALARRAMQ